MPRALTPSAPAALQRELRQLQLRLGQLESTSSSGAPAALAPGGGGEQQHASGGGAGSGALDLLGVAFPLRPVGILRSCFSRRNGTPRQPLLVPAARARLTLRPGLSGDFLEGLGQYSHCWVLYIFHENTDLQRLWHPERDSGVRAKIRRAWNGGRGGGWPHRQLSASGCVACCPRASFVGWHHLQL